MRCAFDTRGSTTTGSSPISALAPPSDDAVLCGAFVDVVAAVDGRVVEDRDDEVRDSRLSTCSLSLLLLVLVLGADD